MKTNAQLFQVSHNDQVNCVKIVDELLVTCGENTVRFWKVENGDPLDTLYLPNWCHNFDLNSEQTLLAVAHRNGVSIYKFSSRIKLRGVCQLCTVNFSKNLAIGLSCFFERWFVTLFEAKVSF